MSSTQTSCVKLKERVVMASGITLGLCLLDSAFNIPIIKWVAVGSSFLIMGFLSNYFYGRITNPINRYLAIQAALSDPAGDGETQLHYELEMSLREGAVMVVLMGLIYEVALAEGSLLDTGTGDLYRVPILGVVSAEDLISLLLLLQFLFCFVCHAALTIAAIIYSQITISPSPVHQGASPTFKKASRNRNLQ